MNIILLCGSLLGLSSVMMAAYIDHSLSLYLNEIFVKRLFTATKYHQLYSIIISMIGISLYFQPTQKIKIWLKRAAYLFIAGILLFSFSIYFSAMMNIAYLNYLIPVGGLTLMLGWCCLICLTLKAKINK